MPPATNDSAESAVAMSYVSHSPAGSTLTTSEYTHSPIAVSAGHQLKRRAKHAPAVRQVLDGRTGQAALTGDGGHGVRTCSPHAIRCRTSD